MSSQITLGEVLSDIDNNTSKLVDFYSAFDAFLAGISEIRPEMMDVVSTLKYDNLLAHSNLTRYESQLLASGVISDQLYKVSSLFREVTLIYQTKADVYSSENFLLDKNSRLIQETTNKHINYIKGITPEQKGILR